jgi:hypothetical protein
MDYKAAGEKRILDPHELEELGMSAYENAKIYKDRTKKWHNKRILIKEFKVGELVLLFNSSLKLFPRKLCSRWSGPYEITKVFQNVAFETKTNLMKFLPLMDCTSNTISAQMTQITILS